MIHQFEIILNYENYENYPNFSEDQHLKKNEIQESSLGNRIR